MTGTTTSAQVRDAWDVYARTNETLRSAARRLDLLPTAAVAKASEDRYRAVMQYLLGHAPPTVRAWFLDRLLDDTLRDNDNIAFAVTAIGTVEGAVVRAALPDFARKVLSDDPESTDLTALHVLWLYGQYAALRLILNSWQSRRDQEDIDEFEAEHPTSDLPASDVHGQPASGSPDGSEPDRLPSRPPLVVTAADIAEAASAWDEYESALSHTKAAGLAVQAAGPRLVFDYAISVGAGPKDTRGLLNWWHQDNGFADAVAVLGAQFFDAYFEALLDLSAVSAFVAAPLIRSLRLAARTAGRPDLVTKVDQVEHQTYGEFGESGYYIIKVRD